MLEKLELSFKEDGQEYVQVTKMLDNGRLEAVFCNGSKLLCYIPENLEIQVLFILFIFSKLKLIHIFIFRFQSIKKT